MLVLTRKKDQGIIIGDNIKIYVNKIISGQVQIGIDAPGLQVDRIEIRQTKEEKAKAKNEK